MMQLLVAMLDRRVLEVFQIACSFLVCIVPGFLEEIDLLRSILHTRLIGKKKIESDRIRDQARLISRNNDPQLILFLIIVC
jgi:hypothetical protein